MGVEVVTSIVAIIAAGGRAPARRRGPTTRREP